MSDIDQHEGCSCNHEMSDEQLLSAQAENIVNLAFTWLQKDRLDAAEIHLVTAAKLIAMSGNEDSTAAASYHHARSMRAQKAGHKKAALRHTRKSFAIYKKQLPADHYTVAVAQMNFGECLAESGGPKGREILAEGIEKFKAADVGTDERMIAWKDQAIEEALKVLAKLS